MGQVNQEIQIVLLCEDKQQRVFVSHFLERTGRLATPKSKRRFRIEMAPGGSGAAERYVRERFPKELAEHRRRHASTVLIVMLDGDRMGTGRRVAELDAACRQRGVPVRRTGENVFVFAPTWRIESWFAYLDGETVDEEKRDYPRLRKERDCRRHVDVLVRMCREGRLREPAPSSLSAACEEYARWH